MSLSWLTSMHLLYIKILWLETQLYVVLFKFTNSRLIPGMCTRVNYYMHIATTHVDLLLVALINNAPYIK